MTVCLAAKCKQGHCSINQEMVHLCRGNFNGIPWVGDARDWRRCWCVRRSGLLGKGPDAVVEGEEDLSQVDGVL